MNLESGPVEEKTSGLSPALFSEAELPAATSHFGENDKYNSGAVPVVFRVTMWEGYIGKLHRGGKIFKTAIPHCFAAPNPPISPYLFIL